MIDTHITAKYYAIFYFAAFAFAFLLKLVEGKQRKFPWITWLSLSIFAQTLFVIGTKAITISFADWQMAFQTLQLPNTLQRSLLGGILSFILVFFVARYFLKFKNDFLDAMAIPSVIGLTIQRFGCFFGGCCFGTPTNVPWAVSYNAGSPAYFSQVDSGLISRFDLHSLPIHPTQLYYVLTGILIVGILLVFRRKIRVAGNLFVLALSLFAFSRFTVEFFVDVHGNQIASQLVFGLKVVQWVTLTVGAGLMVLFRYRERHSNAEPLSTAGMENDYLKSSLLLFISFVATFYCKNWFSIMELHLLRAGLLIAVGLVAVKLYATYNSPFRRVVHLAMGLSMFVLMSQTLIPAATDNKATDKFESYGFEGTQGSYQSSSNEICDNTYSQRSLTMGNLNYSYTRSRTSRPYRWQEFGAKLYVGSEDVTDYSYFSRSTGEMSSEKGTHNLFAIAINPYVKFNFQYVGLSGGLLINNYSFLPLVALPVIPQLGVRFGRENLVYFKGSFMSNPISGSELPVVAGAIGTGFGGYNRSYLELGYGSSYYSGGVFTATGTIAVDDNYKLKSTVVYGNQQNSMISLGLIYKLKK